MSKITLNRYFGILMIFMLSGVTLFSQSGLLYKITGKDLKKPSYIFGSIHSDDERVFDLDDSIYHALMNSDAFALEVHPDSLVYKLFGTVDNGSYSGKLTKDLLSDSEFKKLETRVKLETGFELEDLNYSNPYYIIDLLGKGFVGNSSKTKYLDNYLYNIAKYEQKPIIGIGNIDKKIRSENTSNDSIVKSQILNFIEEKEQPIYGYNPRFDKEILIELYAAEKLNKILQKYNSYRISKTAIATLPEEVTLRNKDMVSNLINIMGDKSIFVEVGLMHLVGKSGIINSLRSRGYKVISVDSSERTGLLDSYDFYSKSSPWFEYKDTLADYTIKMPGSPIRIGNKGLNIDMNVYPDIGKGNIYFTASMVQFSSEIFNDEDILSNIVSQYTLNSKYNLLSEVDIKDDISTGKEIILENKNEYFLFRIYTRNRIVYLNGFGANSRSELSGINATRFFDSFEFKTLHFNECKEFRSDTFGFSVMTKDKLHYLKLKHKGSVSHTFSNVDKLNNVGYYILIKDLPKDNYINNKYEMLSLNMNELISTLNCVEHRIDTIEYLGNYCLELTCKVKSETVYYKTFYEGNRYYILGGSHSTAFDKKDDIDKFFDSFNLFSPIHEKLIPYKSENFTAFLPEGTEIIKGKNEQVNKFPIINSSSFYFSKDKYNGTPFFITEFVLSKYAVFPSLDSAYIFFYENFILDKNDKISLVDFGDDLFVNAREYKVTSSNYNYSKNIKIIFIGDKVYLLEIYPSKYINCDKYEDFFYNFEVKNPTNFELVRNYDQVEVDILRDICTHNPRIRKEAFKAFKFLGNTSFSKEQVYTILNYYIENFKISDYKTIQPILAELGKYPEKKSYDILSGYFKLGENYNLKKDILTILNGYKTKGAVQLIKELFINEKEGFIDIESYSLIFNDIKNNHLDLSIHLFPEILSVKCGIKLESIIYNLAESSINKSFIQKNIFSDLSKNIEHVIQENIEYLRSNPKKVSYMNIYLLTDALKIWSGYNWTEEKAKFFMDFDNPNATVLLTCLDILLNHNINPSKNIIDFLFNDIYNGYNAYLLYKKYNIIEKIPLKYRNKEFVTKSLVNNWLIDSEFEPESIEVLEHYIPEGKDIELFFFKIKYRNSAKSFLCLAGELSTKNDGLEIIDEYVDLSWDSITTNNDLPRLKDSLIKKYKSYSQW